MNPDGDENQNTSSNTPDADPMQQAIFTPNSTPPSSNQPQDPSVVTGSVVEPASTGLSHPYLSNHPTQTFASETGDIIINNTKPQPKSKKFWVIGGVVGVIALILVFLTIFSRTPNTMLEVESKFNEFANYILFGRSSTNRLTGEYDSTVSYEIDKKFYDRDTDFFSKANALLEKIIDLYGETDDDALNNYALVKIKNIYNDLRFLSLYISAEEIDEDDISRIFVQSGDEAAQKYLSNFYNQMDDLNSTEAKQYVSKKIEQYSAMIELLQLYSSQGCINGELVTMNCLLDNGSVEKANELIEVINFNERTTESIAPNLLKTIANNCWQISWDLQNGYDKENKE